MNRRRSTGLGYRLTIWVGIVGILAGIVTLCWGIWVAKTMHSTILAASIGGIAIVVFVVVACIGWIGAVSAKESGRSTMSIFSMTGGGGP